MNLYEYSLKYFENQTIKYIPNLNMEELEWYYKTPKLYLLNKYKVSIEKGKESINDIMKLFAFFFSSSYDSNIPFYQNNLLYCKLETILNNFNPNYIGMLKEENLYKLFEENLKDEDTIVHFFNEAYWFSYSKKLVSAANYLLKYYKDFDSYLYHINNKPYDALKELLEVYGLRVYEIIEYLSYFGCYVFWKPSPHKYHIDIFNIIDDSVKDFDSFILEFRKICEKESINPYSLFNIISMICEPKYIYHKRILHYKKDNVYLERFKEELKEAINKGIVTI